MATDSADQALPNSDRITRWLLIAIGIYSAIVVSFLTVVILAGGTINPTSLIGGFWIFVYGLMVYLPACTVPRERGARPLRWWHYPMAVFLPLLGVIPGGLVATILRQLLSVQFFPDIQ